MPPDEAVPVEPRASDAGPSSAAHGGVVGSTRRDPRLLLWAAGLLLVIRIVTGIREDRHPPEVIDRVSWQPIAAAETQARAAHKPILYDFTADWCPPCQLMKREVFSDEKLARRINSMFFPVRVLDRSREEGANPPEVAQLQTRFKVQEFPTVVVVSIGDGSPTVIEGYPGREAMMKQLIETQTVMKVKSFHFGGSAPDSAGH